MKTIFIWRFTKLRIEVCLIIFYCVWNKAIQTKLNRRYGPVVWSKMGTCRSSWTWISEQNCQTYIFSRRNLYPCRGHRTGRYPSGYKCRNFLFCLKKCSHNIFSWTLIACFVWRMVNLISLLWPLLTSLKL